MLGMFALFMFGAVFAQSVETTSLLTTIADVDVPASLTEETLVFAHTEGRVLRVDTRDEKLVQAFKKAQKDHYVVSVRINEDGSVVGAMLLGKSQLKKANKVKDAEDYQPTIVSSPEKAVEYFEEMRGGAKSWSQCFNRAHVWAHDLWSDFSLKSMKVFLFFTRSYIREYNFKWWFHVAPYVLVNVDGKVEERVIDPTFTWGPTPMKEWTDEFMYEEPTCPEVKKYSEYANNQFSNPCYLFKVPMYYWEPNNLEALETQGIEYKDWDYGQLSTARRQAFW